MVSAAAYRAARTHAASIDRSDRGRILVSGPDRASYLQGLLTNDVAALTAGAGCYAAYLTPQGRMIADLFVYELGGAMLLVVAGRVKDAMLARLDRFVFTEDVTLADATDSLGEIAIVGPAAADVLSRVSGNITAAQLTALAEYGSLRVDVAGRAATVTRVVDTGEPGFEIYVERALVPELQSRLAELGAAAIDAETADALRLEAGIPVFGRDMDEETIPLEAGIESRAISFTKGCYVGQEVIVRVMHRGHGRVARRLTGLILDGEAPPPSGSIVRAGEREIGRVTSSTMSPALEKPIALAYLHRDFLTPGLRVSVDGAAAAVTELPFVRQ
jgi:tRNA-modifying protein YgfZ